jgi:hypothetical protein
MKCRVNESFPGNGVCGKFTRLEKLQELTGDKAAAANIRLAFEQGGYPAVLRWLISDLTRQSSKRYVSPVGLAVLYAQLGRREETLSLLEEAARQRSPHVLWMQNDPAFDFLRSDERYRSLIRRSGLPPGILTNPRHPRRNPFNSTSCP